MRTNITLEPGMETMQAGIDIVTVSAVIGGFVVTAIGCD